MTVEELIKQLKKLPNQKSVVYVASDAEGNEICPMFSVERDTSGSVVIWPSHRGSDCLE